MSTVNISLTIDFPQHSRPHMSLILQIIKVLPSQAAQRLYRYFLLYFLLLLFLFPYQGGVEGGVVLDQRAVPDCFE